MHKIWTEDGICHDDDFDNMYMHDGRWCYDRKIIHRIDGPAIIYRNDIVNWVVHGIHCQNWQKFQKVSKIFDEEISILILKYGSI